jgi:hypothetical protein
LSIRSRIASAWTRRGPASPEPRQYRPVPPDAGEFPLFYRDLQEAAARRGRISRGDSAAPGPVHEYPAQPSPTEINARADELRQVARAAHTAFNKPAPDDIKRDRCIALDVAEYELYTHLSDYRGELGKSPQWAREYAVIYDGEPRRGALAFPEAPEYPDAPEL